MLRNVFFAPTAFRGVITRRNYSTNLQLWTLEIDQVADLGDEVAQFFARAVAKFGRRQPYFPVLGIGIHLEFV